MMNAISHGRQYLRVVVLAILLAVMGGAQAAYADAEGVPVSNATEEVTLFSILAMNIKEVASWVSQEAHNAYMKAAKIIELANWEWLKNLLPTLSQGIIGAIATQTKVLENLFQGLINFMAYEGDTRTVAMIQSSPEAVPPVGKAVCALSDLVTISQNFGAMAYDNALFSEALVSSIENLCMQPDMDCMGPQFTAMIMDMGCPQGKTGEGLFNALHGLPKECNAPEPKPAEIDFRDCMFNSVGMSGAYAAERAPMTPVKQTVRMPNGSTITRDAYIFAPTTPEQKLFVCLWARGAIAGRMPQPTQAPLSANGSADFMKYMGVNTPHSALLSAYMDWVAFMTRKNCADATGADQVRCQAYIQSCKSAVAQGVSPTPDVNCDRGLSTLQQLKLEMQTCGTPNYVENLLASGSGYAQAQQAIPSCNSVRANNQRRIDDTRNAAASALAKLLSLLERFPSSSMPAVSRVQAGEGITPRTFDEVSARSVPGQEDRGTARVAPISASRKPARAAQGNAVSKSNMPQAADEISWPVSVEQ